VSFAQFLVFFLSTDVKNANIVAEKSLFWKNWGNKIEISSTHCAGTAVLATRPDVACRVYPYFTRRPVSQICHTLSFFISLPAINRFSKFFYWHILRTTGNKVVTKYLIPP